LSRTDWYGGSEAQILPAPLFMRGQRSAPKMEVLTLLFAFFDKVEHNPIQSIQGHPHPQQALDKKFKKLVHKKKLIFNKFYIT
jgi:hypothetical protein